MSHRAMFVASLSCVVFSGCSFTSGEDWLANYPLPESRGALPAEFWSQAKDSKEATDAKDAKDGTGSDVLLWLLPTWIDIDARSFDDERKELDDIDVKFVNPGFLTLPMLPLYIGGGVDRYATDGSSSRSAFTWTPFWAWSETEGKGPIEFTASGIPLLWGSITARTTESNLDLRIRHYLWSLASFYLSLGLDVGGSRLEGYAFVPFYVGGLGTNLWSSAAFQADFGEVSFHGPFEGWLGYRHAAGLSPDSAIAIATAEDLLEAENLNSVLDEPDTTKRFERTNQAGYVPWSSLWLGGALWASWAESDPNGKEYDSRHGPLWTMFGYGTENGEPTIVLFWWEF